jgi:hypothetical protein
VEDAARYFEVLFGDAVDAARRIVIWTLPNKHSQFCTTVAAAADCVKGLSPELDVYCGVGLYRAGIKRGRGKAADVVAIPALWADIDYGPEHRKPRTPANEKAAGEIVAAIGVSPSFQVRSGHGIHAYWLLKEPLTAEDDHAAKARAWSDTVVTRARDLWLACDAVGDLSRVLRVPGTLNHKAEEPRPVTVTIPDNPQRYDWHHLERFLFGEMQEPSAASAGPLGGRLILSPDAYPNGRILDAALSNDPKFRRTWEHRRTDLSDQSPSAYDLALACWGVAADLDDQGVADLIIGFRRKHGHDLTKVLDRADYLLRTIKCARSANARTIDDKTAVREQVIGGLFNGKSTDETLTTLRSQLGIPLARVIKRGESNARYALVLDDGREIAIGRTATMLSVTAFRTALCDATITVLPEIPRKTWHRIRQALVTIAELVSFPDAEHQITTWLEEYIASRVPHKEEEWQQALLQREPFYRKGMLWFHLTSFRTWLTLTQNERLESQDLKVMLHAGGYSGKRVDGRIGGSHVCRWYWTGPPTSGE